MARTQYTVTFPAAKAGDEVTWPNTVKIYPDASTSRPLGNGYIEVAAGSFTGWSDAASVTFTRAGTSDSVTVTTGSPTGTGAAVPTAASSATLLAYTATGADFSAVAEPFALAGSAGAPVATPTVGDWAAAVGVGSPVACAALTAGVYLARLQWFQNVGVDFAGAFVYVGTIHGNDVMPLYLTPPAGQSSSTYAHFALGLDDVIYVAGGADNPEASRAIDLTLTFVKVADFG